MTPNYEKKIDLKLPDELITTVRKGNRVYQHHSTKKTPVVGRVKNNKTLKFGKGMQKAL